MPTREYVNANSSGYGYDNGESDCILLFISGPRGGTRCTEVLSTVQARELRDRIDQALTRIADARARTPAYVVVLNAGYEGERDLHEANTYEAALQWRRDNYDGDAIAHHHIEVARDIAGERSYEL